VRTWPVDKPARYRPHVANAIQIREPDLAQLYAQALVAIARADDELGLEEGMRLQQKMDARLVVPIAIDDLLLAEPLDPAALGEIVGAGGGPFRGGSLHPGELARLIVVDSVEVVLAKGHITEEEATVMIQFATALGCTLAEVRSMTVHLSPWLAHLR
jgi:tellurite resistance protein